ncbi:glycosyltransferase family 2 protein [Pedobacter alluvionis]|uniref:Glycosyltransferase family 2 protein n=1 Tax=Pedobacter alluvionis TaxID=475253 RepID=A0A497YC06_9SPHI|nr:glycosyltransferase family 2 protein [Pedobacter alluvionis]RLJ77689.1 glycosyltransferase involved in cell wall biosynthesis [Pedobacter alluvionis]TFB33109.1 glycosyltransferase family 2 protein [Pedobacter alluvionis]
MKKTVSFIIPTHNYGHLIGYTLDCLLNQSYLEWEAIIIDDGSTDNTEEIVKSFLDKDDRLIYLKQNQKGVSAARNKGLSLARGYYIQFLDADDLITEDKVKLQIQFLEANKDVDICMVSTRFFRSSDENLLYTDFALKNEKIMPLINGAGHQTISTFIECNPTAIQGPLFRKKHIDKTGTFNENMRYVEDWDFWFRFAINNFNFGFLDDNKALALVRVHADSATQQSDSIIVAQGEFRNFVKGYLESSSLPGNEKKELSSKNEKLLINTFKLLMAETDFKKIGSLFRYYKKMNNGSAFLLAFIKSINLKRKTFVTKSKRRN